MFYAVRKGRETGVFESWRECERMVRNFSGAEFKSFATTEEAQAYLDYDPVATMPEDDYAFVDGSYNVKTGVYGYGLVLVHNGKRYLSNGKGTDPSLASMRNVAGEILGARQAVALAVSLGMSEITLCYDYKGIECWATGEWKANLDGTKDYALYIKNAPIKVKFFKVKAHSGVEGNEEVDNLAKKAVGVI